MSNLITRAASGVIYILLFLAAILYSKESYVILITIFGLLSVWEFSKLVKLNSIVPYLFVGFLGYAAYAKNDNKLIWILLAFCLICGIRLIIYLYSKKNSYPTHNFEKLDLSVRYIAFSFFFLLLIPFTTGNYNPYIIIGILVLIWVNDSFAYLIGKNFGKHKLFEKVSPRKTIEGFIGGLVFSTLSAIILSEYIPVFSTLNWVIIALITSVFGTLGDLVESKFKRQANVKDSGNIMPGHGGILDRLDSLFFLAPFVYLYINYFI
ncbi:MULTISPECIES: phosphatidate cytidylyltransferase [Tenacibaculum]|uniref:phosphatidate cytidylyltransferase n=1 Tax=Tenacibaculum TaxID=104267 RepID=UPI001F0B3617|nr:MULTISPECIES: phosphatidate cytidylyltransferase [Tenacibaculum]MCH3882354.1 phosphatidate cytidylyltransferase [Tenacibaculum aquimarinum]MDO6600176.1 phosphatidate cytidylyltransferase [Tenacibaculum sp. 1_MG-2023]